MTHYLSVFCFVKNESLILREWLEHYLWQGVDHIFLFDNDSSDRPEGCISGLGSFVTIQKKPGRLNQNKMFNQAFGLHGKTSEWVIFCDADEFWFGHRQRLVDVIRKRDSQGFSSIFTNWKHFGAMGRAKQPESARLSLTMRGPVCGEPFDGKVATRTKNTLEIGVHSNVVTGKKIRDNRELSLNHYRIGSDEYFDIKRNRNRRYHSPLVRKGLPFNWFVRDWDHYRELHDLNEIEDTALRDLVIRGYS